MCVCVCVCVHVCVRACLCVCVGGGGGGGVPKLTSRMFICDKINTAYLTCNADQMICGKFASFVICLPTVVYSDIAVVFCATFQRAF